MTNPRRPGAVMGRQVLWFLIRQLSICEAGDVSPTFVLGIAVLTGSEWDEEGWGSKSHERCRLEHLFLYDQTHLLQKCRPRKRPTIPALTRGQVKSVLRPGRGNRDQATVFVLSVTGTTMKDGPGVAFPEAVAVANRLSTGPNPCPA